MEKTRIMPNPLGKERIGKLMIRFAVPSIISLVVNSLYNMVDQIFIGNGVGNAIVLTIAFGVIFTILCQIFLEPLCWMFGATEQSISYCLEYGRPIILGFTFLSIDMAFTIIIRADGRANISLVGMLIGCAANVILDPIFIFVFKWGVAGAGWATIIGQILNAIYFIICITRCKTVKLEKKHFSLKLKISGKMCMLGLSSFITQFALVVVIAVVNNTLKATGEKSIYGADIPVSVMGVVMKVSQVLTSIVLGIATGILPVISYNYGSGQHDRVKKLFKYAITAGTIVMTAAFFILEIWPRQIVSIFGTQSELYMEFAQKCIQTYMLLCFTVGVSIVTGIFFQSIDKPIQSTVLSLLRQIVVLVPSVLILGAVGDVTTVLWAGPISDGISCIASLVALVFCWKKIFYKEEK